ncbi:MAG: hypothetical protein KGO81_06310 [Bacteroidota bacterium]|nr:hypothetical protein [Bacteroidota bacterium]
MLTEQEESFIKYWAANREYEKKSFKQFLKGLSSGISIGIGIVLVIIAGWYERANMEANTQMNPFILLLVIAIISVFMAYFYRNYQWEMKEQRYLELLARKRKQENKGANAAE